VEYHWADDRDDRLPRLAGELVRRQPAVILASTGTSAALAAKAASSAIPVVFCVGGDPIRNRLVASLNRPGGNVTGVSYLTNMLGPKRLGLLRELLPAVAEIRFLYNRINPNAAADIRELEMASREAGLSMHPFSASAVSDFDKAFENLSRNRKAAVLVASDTFFLSNRSALVASAERHGIPTSYDGREYPVAGGLISYGPSRIDAFRQAGIYVGQILKGANPAELPVMQPTRIELVINRKAAKALGLEIPPTLLALADEVIE
jgi:putative ABC transport system substrate-binding protein